jgi:hypothetical protein
LENCIALINVRAFSGLFLPPIDMPINRSQSAPQTLESIKDYTSKDHQTNLRLKSYFVENLVTSSPLTTSWVEKEDPFSLASFFPASYRAVPEEEWKWLRKDEDEDTARDDKESLAVEEMITQLEDELTEETIKSEDKFGLLSLGMFDYHFDL